jgi:hypothetical protein
VSEFTIRVSDPPEVSHAGRDYRFVTSPSGTVHERPECDSDDHDYAFHAKCGQRLPGGSKWGRVEAETAEEIAEQYPHLAFCLKCFTNSYRLDKIRWENQR